jgi:hypothetical protein
LGVGVSSKEIIKFLKENNVKYNSRGWYEELCRY